MTDPGDARTRPWVLVVDDDLNARILMRECLEQAGFRVEEAGDGAQGLSLFHRLRPDILLLDVIMPGMDGFDVCTHIRESEGEGGGIPILMLTGLEDEESIDRAYEVGATDFISKPLNWVILPYRIRYLLRASRAIAELSQAYEELKSLDKAKDTFLSSVSHEFRTPLTSIRSFSEILLTYEDTAVEERKEFLRIIKSESERLTRLIDNILDISKIEGEKMIWNDALVRLDEIVMDAVKAQDPLLKEKALELKTEFPVDLVSLLADRDRIQQVVTNLLNNAIKFSPQGGTIRIWAEMLEGRRSGEPPVWVKVAISDQGMGLDEKDFDVIFDKLSQVCSDAMTDKPGGTGLGLPISKEIILHYGGNIWLESRKGEGSTFYFSLPGATESQQASGTGDARTGSVEKERERRSVCGE
jgi:signal transduction histidine kinase